MTTDWLTDDLIEPLAIAVCFGEFSVPEAVGCSAREYWERVGDGPKAHYRRTAKRLLLAALNGHRLMPKAATPDLIASYMEEMRLANKANARKHYATIYAALPPIWDDRAEAIRGVTIADARREMGEMG